MLIANNDEEKRSKLWKIITLSTTILIMLIATFFITKLFTDNPLEGTWKHQDSNLTITIKSNSTMIVLWDKLFEERTVKIGMNYVLDKEKKTVAFKIDEAEIEKAVKDSDEELTAEGLESDLGILETTYDYSIDKRQLTLTEREYGEQLIFDKQ